MSVLSSESDMSTKMKFVQFKDKLEFVQDEADTPGMEKKYGKYNIGIKLNETNLGKIKQLSLDFNTENPVKDNELFYLKEKHLSGRQKSEILYQGPMTVKVKFQLTGVRENTDDDVRHLVFRILGLEKVSDDSAYLPMDDF